MQTAPHANPRRCLLRAAAVFLLGLVEGRLWTTSFGATTILDPAQVARQFIQRSWQKKDGLPDNTVQALLQTRDGYLWIGTSRGLVRFDGLKFAVFDHVNSPEMVNDNCRSLAEDLAGNLWIGTADGLLRLRDGKFKRFTRKDGLAYSRAETRDRVGPIHADRRGNVWVTTVRLNLLRGDSIRSYGIPQGLMAEAVFTIHEDAAGML